MMVGLRGKIVFTALSLAACGEVTELRPSPACDGISVGHSLRAVDRREMAKLGHE